MATQAKTFLCSVAFYPGYFVSNIAVTSPKTGRTITIAEPFFRHCSNVVDHIREALPNGGMTKIHLSVQDLRDVLDANSEARESYKESLHQD